MAEPLFEELLADCLEAFDRGGDEALEEVRGLEQRGRCCRVLRQLRELEELRDVCKDMANHDWVPGRGAYDAAAQLVSIGDPQDRERVKGDVLVFLRQSAEQGYATPERLGVEWLSYLGGEARYEAAMELARRKVQEADHRKPKKRQRSPR